MTPEAAARHEIEIARKVRQGFLSHWPLFHDEPDEILTDRWTAILYLYASRIDEASLNLEVTRSRTLMKDGTLITDLRWFFRPRKVITFPESAGSNLPVGIVDIPVLVPRALLDEGPPLKEEDFLMRDRDFSIDLGTRTVTGVDLSEYVAPLVWVFINGTFESLVSEAIGENYGESDDPWSLLGNNIARIREYLAYRSEGFRDSSRLTTLFGDAVGPATGSIPGTADPVNGVHLYDPMYYEPVRRALAPWKVIESIEEGGGGPPPS